MSDRWLYKVVVVKPKWLSVSTEQIEATLAPLGLQGWELVSTMLVATNVHLFLKKGY